MNSNISFAVSYLYSYIVWFCYFTSLNLNFHISKNGDHDIYISCTNDDMNLWVQNPLPMSDMTINAQ